MIDVSSRRHSGRPHVGWLIPTTSLTALFADLEQRNEGGGREIGQAQCRVTSDRFAISLRLSQVTDLLGSHCSWAAFVTAVVRQYYRRKLGRVGSLDRDCGPSRLGSRAVVSRQRHTDVGAVARRQSLIRRGRARGFNAIRGVGQPQWLSSRRGSGPGFSPRVKGSAGADGGNL
jgi:hypothetical protein